MQSIRQRIGLILCMAAMMYVPLRGADSTVNYIKVHKKQIMVSEPDELGQVHVRGEVGAIEATDSYSVHILHMNTEETTPVSFLSDDGSFIVKVKAAAGDDIRVYARNEHGKKSYGTFTVPGTVKTALENRYDAPSSYEPEPYAAGPYGNSRADVHPMAAHTTAMEVSSPGGVDISDVESMDADDLYAEVVRLRQENAMLRQQLWRVLQQLQSLQAQVTEWLGPVLAMPGVE